MNEPVAGTTRDRDEPAALAMATSTGRLTPAGSGMWSASDVMVRVNEEAPPNEVVRAGPRRLVDPRLDRAAMPESFGRTAIAPPSLGTGREFGLIEQEDECGTDPSAWGLAGPSAGLSRILSRRPSRPCDEWNIASPGADRKH